MRLWPRIWFCFIFTYHAQKHKKNNRAHTNKHSPRRTSEAQLRGNKTQLSKCIVHLFFTNHSFDADYFHLFSCFDTKKHSRHEHVFSWDSSVLCWCCWRRCTSTQIQIRFPAASGSHFIRYLDIDLKKCWQFPSFITNCENEMRRETKPDFAPCIVCRTDV